MTSGQNGKGDGPRSVRNDSDYRNSWDRIFSGSFNSDNDETPRRGRSSSLSEAQEGTGKEEASS
jgi:hypothetical protein